MSAFVTSSPSLPTTRFFSPACGRPRRLREQLPAFNRCTISSSASQPAAETQPEIRYEDDGSRVLPVNLFLRGTAGETVAGVYGVLDAERQLRYVGMSRNVADSLRLHSENHGPDTVYFMKVMTFRSPQPAEMKMIVDTWIRENDSLPIGNQENWLESDHKLAKEVSLLPSLAQDADEDPIISPFASGEVDISAPKENLDLTIENVDVVLDEVRPFLISDGGNVAVVSVDAATGKVELQLKGACGSCSSATVTMQMGIEKALREKFGDKLGKVVALPSEDDATPDLSIQSCEAALDEVRDALRGMGAAVSILEIDDGEVIVSFTGPNNVKYGVEMILRDKIPGVTDVTFE